MKRIALAPLALVLSCGSSATTTSTSPGDAPHGDADGGASIDATTAPPGTTPPDGATGGGGAGHDSGVITSCSGLLTQPRDAVWTLDSDAGARSYRVHVPSSYDPSKPMPLVLDFHGYSSNGSEEDFLNHMTTKGDAAGFLVVQPEGLSNSWNAGACCGQSASSNVDDIGFVNAMLDALEAKLCVDRARVYATGMSNGGFFSHRIGCELASRIAAVAPVAGLLGVPACNPARPISVMHFHGTGDTIVPYAGSTQSGWPSATDTFAGWAKRDGCTGDPAETFRKGDAHCATYQTCAAGTTVTLCTIDNGGHTWPGGTPIPTGNTTTNLSATDAMWTFFQANTLPALP